MQPGKVWEFIADPLLMMKWNPRIIAVVPVTAGGPQPNAEYRIRYMLVSKESNYSAEILEFEEHNRITLHLSGGDLPKRGFIQESYEIAQDSRGILLLQSIIIEKSGLGLCRRLALRLKNMIGPVSGKKYLLKLRDLSEDRS